MNMAAPRLIPEMREFNVSNHLLGDQDGLRAVWERDGYWFFRDVLDKQAIAELRQVYMDYLGELGVADPQDPEARYNGADLSVMPPMVNETAMNERRVDRVLHRDPRIAAFFERLFGCDPFWVPFTVHRQVPPARDRDARRLEFIHQDGTYNDGLDFLICWIPLAEITPDVGGLALVEGVHRCGSLHRKDGMKILPIAEEDMEVGRWRSTHYRPGDVLLMDLNTPHSGITNHSDRFRLSVDTRIMPSNGNLPVVGTITAVSADGVTIGDRTLRFDATSFVRGLRGDQMPLADIPSRYRVGQEVIAAVTGDLVRNMRPIQ
nr:phytanoyl-CoA dioxygenase family protein [Sphingomonas sp. Y57]